MFVKSKTSASKGGHVKRLAAAAACLSMLSAGVPAAAVDGHVNTRTIPVNITIDGLRESTVPLYISVQKRGEYMSIKGHGIVLQKTSAGTMQASVKVDAADDYAVSLWHDLDNDGKFSMNERYEIEDGWGASGSVPMDRQPTFDDVKVTVPVAGQTVIAAMIYPK